MNCDSIEKHRPVFFFADLCFVFEKRMQKLVFLLAYTKKSTEERRGVWDKHLLLNVRLRFALIYACGI